MEFPLRNLYHLQWPDAICWWSSSWKVISWDYPRFSFHWLRRNHFSHYHHRQRRLDAVPHSQCYKQPQLPLQHSGDSFLWKVPRERRCPLPNKRRWWDLHTIFCVTLLFCLGSWEAWASFYAHDQCLPILHLNTGLNYYQAFCSCVKQSYEDAVHFAFFWCIWFQMMFPPRFALARELIKQLPRIRICFRAWCSLYWWERYSRKGSLRGSHAGWSVAYPPTKWCFETCHSWKLSLFSWATWLH